MKVDVIIPTRNPTNIRPKLLRTLHNAEWVNQLIIETSKPLSYARVNGARKASTEWIVMIDDDVELPSHWFEIVASHVNNPKVIAVSTEIWDTSKHDSAFRTMLAKIQPNYWERNFDNHAYLIKREILLNWNPPPCFYCEDDLLFHFVLDNYGKWLNLQNIGGRHYGIAFLHPNRVPWAYYLRAYKIWAKPRGNLRYIKNCLGKMFLALFLPVYSGSLKTTFFWMRWSVQQLTGWFMAMLDGY